MKLKNKLAAVLATTAIAASMATSAWAQSLRLGTEGAYRCARRYGARIRPRANMI